MRLPALAAMLFTLAAAATFSASSVAAGTSGASARGDRVSAHAFRPGKPIVKRVGGCIIEPRGHCAGVRLQNAELFRANLSHADLWRSRLQGANLAGADLRGARLSGASLAPGPQTVAGRLPGHRTRLVLADLRKARMGGSDLERVIASGADLRNARLVRARIFGADLADADLRRADLSHADLQRADLHHATLAGANLLGANLKQADLRGADLRGARLRGADLVRADLAGAALTRRQLRTARELCDTMSPRGRPENRDCARLHITPHLSAHRTFRPHVDPRLRDHRPRGGAAPVGPRLAGQRGGATAHSASACAPGVGPECAWWYLAFDQFPYVEAIRGDFYMTDFDWANLERSDFEGSFIALAQFDGANLSFANFSHTTPGLLPSTDTAINFNYANLEGVNLEGSNLRGAQFMDANLKGANLRNTNLDVANLDGANLEGANLEGAYMEGTQLGWVNAERANFQGSFMVDAYLGNANLTDALMGVYMLEAPGGGFLGKQGSLNLDSAGWTCGTTLPSGANDSNDCKFTFELLAELLSSVAESVSGFAFGPISEATVLGAAAKAAAENATESVGGTALKFVDWAMYSGTKTGFENVVERSPTLGYIATSIKPVVKFLGVNTAKVVWKIEAPEGLMSIPKVREWFEHHESKAERSVYNPISEWESEWADSLYRWWSRMPAGANFSSAVGCDQSEPPECEPTTFPVRIPDPPVAEAEPLGWEPPAPSPEEDPPLQEETPAYVPPVEPAPAPFFEPVPSLTPEEFAGFEDECFYCFGY